jgi:hypothetical protein
MSLFHLATVAGSPLESILMLVGLAGVFLVLDRLFFRLALWDDD